MRRNETLDTAIMDMVDRLFHWLDGLCGNYALQREETGMLIMCKPLVWFCNNWKKKNLYQKFSNKNAAWCQLNGRVSDLSEEFSLFILECLNPDAFSLSFMYRNVQILLDSKFAGRSAHKPGNNSPILA